MVKGQSIIIAFYVWQILYQQDYILISDQGFGIFM